MLTPFRDFWRLIGQPVASVRSLQHYLGQCQSLFRHVADVNSQGRNESSHPQGGAVEKTSGAWIGSPGYAVLKLRRACVHVCSGRVV